MHWYCQSCDKGVAKVLTALSNVSKRQDKLEDRVTSMGSELNEALTKVETGTQKLEEKLRASEIKVKNDVDKVNVKLNDIYMIN